MQTYSKLKHAHISPQKARLIADIVRGKRVGLALSQLRFMPKKGAELVLKALESAVANAEHNHGADIDELKVSAIQVDVAPRIPPRGYRRPRPEVAGPRAGRPGCGAGRPGSRR